MPYVVTERCIRCVYTDCVEVCPVECFHDAGELLVIDPQECIDCGACVPACPVEAIFFDEDLPQDQLEFLAINERLAQTSPIIFAAKDPHPQAEEYRTVTGKRSFLLRF